MVVIMKKNLLEMPEMCEIKNVFLRNYEGECDMLSWLALRNSVFSELSRGERPWSEKDFQREFLSKSWWEPRRMWLAESTGHDALVGAVALADSNVGGEKFPSVGWLAVASSWRRLGVGRLLMAALERACWERGRRVVTLQTLRSWESAVAFYRALGYHE